MRIVLASALFLVGCVAEDADRLGQRSITVGVDATHANRHTLDGTYREFGRAVEAPVPLVEEAVVVQSVTGPRLTRPILGELHVLVIAGPEQRVTRREVRLIDEWVRDGGALFLVVDHHPYPERVYELAQAFGVELLDGWLHNVERATALEFSIDDRSIRDHPVTDGPYGVVERVFADAGASFWMPEDAVAVAEVPPGWRIRLFEGDQILDAEGMAFIGALEAGAGRVVISGEASMLTCQELGEDGGPRGLCTPGREGQAALVGNAVHWLATGDAQPNR